MKVFRKTKLLVSFEIKNNGTEHNLGGKVEDTYSLNNSAAYLNHNKGHMGPTAISLREDLQSTLVLLRKSDQTRML